MNEDEAGKDLDPDFLEILSHQIKSPIHAIQTLLETIAQGYVGEADEKVLHFIQKALVRSKDAQNIVSDLLDFQYFSDNPTDSYTPFDVVALISELSETYSQIASEKNISITTDIPRNITLMINGNETGMSHALRNLIENAIKYSRDKGNVQIKLTYSTEESSCTIDVSDNGYGIPESEQQNIFKPFFRSIKTKAVISGTGLGLAIVEKVIAAHTGTVSFTSAENKGTTFSVVLPFDTVQEMSPTEGRKESVVIIGGVTAGPKAAARLRRLNENLRITIIEQSNFLSYSGCGLPSYISGKVTSPQALMATGDGSTRDIHFFESIQNINIHSGTRAERIDRKDRRVELIDLKSGKQSTIRYDSLILATGGTPVVPDIPGIDLPGIYTLRSLEDAEKIKQELVVRTAKDVFIIGGGLIGASVTESLIDTGARITILEKNNFILLSQLDADISRVIQADMRSRGIKILTKVDILNIKRNDKALSIQTKGDTYSADLIILSTGVKPNTLLAEEADLDIGPSGGIKVNHLLKTSDESIFAIGDCAESINLITGKHEYWPLGSISTKMGRIAADNICNREEEFTGSIGTAYLKISDLNIARTGLTSSSAFKNGFDPVSVIVTGDDRAHYEAGAKLITLKIIADKNTRKILGAQGCGLGQVAKRIENIAFAISTGMTLNDFFKVDLGYAPAFNNPIDLSQTACTFLMNKIEGLVKTLTISELEKSTEKFNLIDVSSPDQHSTGAIFGSYNIPLERIRKEKLPYAQSSPIVVYSRTSSGAFTAYRYLITKGYSNIFVLEGGYALWEKAH
jgi:NADPH-dependent 2,4-dienoyl-CoA reductase/sulfur reductase-like enzyme/rhodanese-related sulfurtransferase/anti-sigma regulatory factor (Ser/Thr protein kinase)